MNSTSNFRKNLIFVSGKGGVGKTAVSQAIAQTLSREGARTLWVTFEDPTRPAGELIQKNSNLWHLNCDAGLAFEEYAGMKIGMATLTRIFLKNKLVRYLAKAAPGIHELVLLGKVWFERNNYDHVVVDMPSTGYGLAMFQSTQNFSNLFKTGPLYRDAAEMLETFEDPKKTALVIVALPEEMPLRESLELRDYLLSLFPRNPPHFLVNRKFPRVTTPEQEEASPPDSWSEPFAKDAADYARKRSTLESFNLRLWSESGVRFQELDIVPFSPGQTFETIVNSITGQMRDKGIL
jgi:anion-transporting  ArsA/GET3 family ATPase